MFAKIIFGLAVTAALACASGDDGGKTPESPEPANALEIRISSELVPAGGTAQVKYSTTSPQPIMSGGTRFDSFAPDGVSLWSPLGDAAGAAVFNNGSLRIAMISPAASLGTIADSTFLTVTMQVPTTLKNGNTFPLTMDPTAVLTPTGSLVISPKPGVLTVGGDFSIHGVTPGGGTFPGGTIVKIDGKGFMPGAQLRTPNLAISSFKVISSSEIDFTLKSQATLDGQQIDIVNPSGFGQTFYSYLRGTPLHAPSRLLLKSTDPIFQQQTHAIANTGPLAAQSSGQYIALALQNPNPGPAVATLRLIRTDGSVDTTSVLLPSGVRLVDDVAAIFKVPGIRTGDKMAVNSTAGLQILGLMVDENVGTVIPFLPAF